MFTLVRVVLFLKDFIIEPLQFNKADSHAGFYYLFYAEQCTRTCLLCLYKLQCKVIIFPSIENQFPQIL